MIKARASGSKVCLYFMKKGRQARHRIPWNSCFFFVFFFVCRGSNVYLKLTEEYCFCVVKNLNIQCGNYEIT